MNNKQQSAAKYRAKNRDKINAYNKIYRATHKLQQKFYYKEFMEANPTYQKEWRAKNPNYQKEWYAKHKDQLRAKRDANKRANQSK